MEAASWAPAIDSLQHSGTASRFSFIFLYVTQLIRIMGGGAQFYS